ncbi:RNA polymerase recycling motor HelD [Paenibacillus lutrae]|uniref:AAA family ATPase n=1 Tax=Paenibacillus lutrae TaxID=2078573 RepID=A0A7X3JZP3_9BACL|nr:RNA polymerase recycling motor HelD [Paenibacillus lutrae]MVP00250.1 AAA family ATPase [Paenibacillus lutrae]
MSISPEEWKQEQARVDLIRDKLTRQLLQLEPNVGQLKDQVVDIRKHFWDEVTVNLANDDDVLETFLSMKQQAEILSERERSHRHLKKLADRMNRLLPTPYFGRIDFKEDGSGGSERVYVGVSSFLDEDGETFLVYDWRTPIASLYYDFPPGPGEYDTPGGLIRGDIELKRQFIIRNGRIEFLFDTGMMIGDELLQEVLSKGAGSQMKTIVATIQKEQNRIIRNDRTRMLIVQGAAGSGKTSAALQRVAYLLYKHRTTLKADQMVLFSPNPLFNSYVSTVLPELGEENMQQTTFQDYLHHRLGRKFDIEDPFEQIEYVLQDEANKPDYPARIDGIRYKASADFLRLIQRYRDHLGQEDMIFRDYRFRGRVLISHEQMLAQFYSYDPSIRLPNKVVLLKEWLLRELKVLEQEERKADWVREELNYLDNEQYHQAYSRLRNRQQDDEAGFDDADQEEELLKAMIVKEKFKPLRSRTRNLRFVDVPALYRKLFEDRGLAQRLADPEPLPRMWEEICAYTLGRLSRSELPYEDATPYLYLQETIEGFRTNTIVRHVLVDEAQDYSPFQFEFLKRLFPRARMTVLGDFNQAIFAHSTTLQGQTPVADLYGEEETERIVLHRSYRSTKEIVEFTRGMLQDGMDIEPFQREGGKPQVTTAPMPADLVRRMAGDIAALHAEGHLSIGIICKTAAESELAYNELLGTADLRLIRKDTPSFEKGVLVIPAYLAKGVEFDAVLLYDASAANYSRETQRKLFYTACTRAMHRLYLYSAGPLSPFVTALDPSTYELHSIHT